MNDSRVAHGGSPRNFPRCAFAVLLGVVFLWVQPCAGQSVVEFRTRMYGGSWAGPSQTDGWEFIAKEDLSVIQLGLFDGHDRGGFTQPHEIGLWDDTGNLLVSATIDSGEIVPLVGNFRMVGVPTTQLRVGQTYVIGAFMPGVVTDYVYGLDSYNASFYGLRIDPRVQFVQMRQSVADALAFPASTGVRDIFGMFGPGFVVEVPEPRTLSLVVLSILLLTTVKNCNQGAKEKESKNFGKIK